MTATTVVGGAAYAGQLIRAANTPQGRQIANTAISAADAAVQGLVDYGSTWLANSQQSQRQQDGEQDFGRPSKYGKGGGGQQLTRAEAKQQLALKQDDMKRKQNRGSRRPAPTPPPAYTGGYKRNRPRRGGARASWKKKYTRRRVLSNW